MDITALKIVNEDRPSDIEYRDFQKKMKLLKKEELKQAFEVTHIQLQTVLDQFVPCVGCRKR